MSWTVALVSLYFATLIYLGWRGYRRHADEGEFLLSGRTMTLPAMIATLVSTWYGGILGVGEFIYGSGVVAWFVFGVPYYLFALLFAWLAAPKIRSLNYITIPDLLQQNYGRKAAALGGLFIAAITTPAPYLLISGTILAYIFGWNLWPSLLLITLFSTVYLFRGGFRSVVLTDKLQFALMFGGFGLLIYYLFTTQGAPWEIFKQLPESFRSPGGGLPIQEILVWVFIASWTFIDPGFHQRCAAAKDASTARRGVITAVLFWLIFDMMTLWSGLYAVVLLPQSDPLMIYPLLAKMVMPTAGYMLLLLALLSVAMSTVDSFTFLSAQTLGRDLALILRPKKHDAGQLNRFTQVGLAVTALLALLLIWQMPSVVELWYNLGSLFLPALLLPVLGGLYPRLKLSGNKTLTAMALAFLISAAAYAHFIWAGNYWMGLQPFVPGLVFSLVFYALMLLTRKS